MRSYNLVFSAAVVLAALGSHAADVQQPTTESIDLNAYSAIREEGLQHSHVMDYAGGLIDGIGPRLTGSPNMAKANAWTRDQLTKMGCVNAHLEDWGEFGMGWQQLNTWVRMTEPDTAVFRGPGHAVVALHQRAGDRAGGLGRGQREQATWPNTKGSFRARLSCSARCAMYRYPTSHSLSATATRTSRSWKSLPLRKRAGGDAGA